MSIGDAQCSDQLMEREEGRLLVPSGQLCPRLATALAATGTAYSLCLSASLQVHREESIPGACGSQAV